MIDFHCHLDLYPNPEEVLRRLVAEGHYALVVTTTPKAWSGTRSLVGAAPRVRVALGLHPELIRERYGEVPLLCSLLDETAYVGEIGLDGSPQYRPTFDLQVSALRTILAACAARGGRILSIHSRAAATKVLDLLDEFPSAGTPVLHWFSGNTTELKRAIHLGCWFSVGPPMMLSAKGRKLVSLMPKERVLTETDGPFTRKGNAPLVPSDVSVAVEGLAGCWRCADAEAQAILYENLRTLGARAITSSRDEERQRADAVASLTASGGPGLR